MHLFFGLYINYGFITISWLVFSFCVHVSKRLQSAWAPGNHFFISLVVYFCIRDLIFVNDEWIIFILKYFYFCG